ncbi:SRPBCC family protein [Brevifollis gellanilyticus]|uniref:Polyketide cyclase n=1 Tax=Brevifollis gellanilyticus TaxID=748831 RepID=A0A512M409_9BACT|nr:SRPBCC family protein [Brevifollis gellanilyticus]GEP41051.1 polyketide cyclase [Brevifollis gellanilyticus]
MIKKILLGLVAILAVVLVIPVFKTPHYRVERSLAIAAPPAVLFDYVNNHKKFNEWNPFAKMDPQAKMTYSGPEAGVGAVSSWAGELTGEGSATITESKPNELVRERMDWKKPMEGVSTVEFTLKPEGDKTVVTWAMFGENNYVGKLMSLVMDCEKMCGPEFEKGLASLSQLVAAKPAP